MPEHLYPPLLLPGLREWFDAFWRLSSERQVGMAIGQIPQSSIERWADRTGMDDDEFLVFEAAIRAMDDVWLENAGKATASSRGAAGNRQPEHTVSDRPMGPALFDALFK